MSDKRSVEEILQLIDTLPNDIDEWDGDDRVIALIVIGAYLAEHDRTQLAIKLDWHPRPICVGKWWCVVGGKGEMRNITFADVQRLERLLQIDPMSMGRYFGPIPEDCQ